MKEVEKELEKLADKEYALFQAKLTPNVSRDLFIGVRVPVLRSFAKEFAKTELSKAFLQELPHRTYDENMLHSLLLSQIKDYDCAVYELDRFLPNVDNWAVCDILSPKILAKHKEKLLGEILRWVKSERVYTIRFGIEMLMSFYLDGDFKSEYLKIPLLTENEDYYVKMMVAWFFATALAKQWEATIPFLEKQTMSDWVHNKTIQKACESYRITEERKIYLRGLKV